MRIQQYFFLDCDSIPVSNDYGVTYNTDNVPFSDPAPSGQQQEGTIATITCDTGMFIPYSTTNSLTISNTFTFTCSSGTFGATAPICKKGKSLILVFARKNNHFDNTSLIPLIKVYNFKIKKFIGYLEC